jgi:hypothetical protein
MANILNRLKGLLVPAAHPIGAACSCARPPFHHTQFERAELGTDEHSAEVAVDSCKRCGQLWLHYGLDDPQYSGSGRWWRAALEPEQRAALTAQQARAFIEQQYACFAGGSYFDSTGFEQRAPIRVA